MELETLRTVLLVGGDDATAEALGVEFAVARAAGYAEALGTLEARRDVVAVVAGRRLRAGPDGLRLLGEVHLARPWLGRVLVLDDPDLDNARLALRTGAVDCVVCRAPNAGEAGAVAAAVRDLVADLRPACVAA